MDASTSHRRRFSSETIVDGRPVRDSALARLRGRVQALRVSAREREEAEVERRLRSGPTVTRANTVAVASPAGGVGKTTSTFVVGNLLASHSRLRVIAVDANPDFGTLADLGPEQTSRRRSVSDLLAGLDELATAAQLRTYVSPLPSGLHLLSGPRGAEEPVAPADYGRLIAFLAIFYEVVLLDLGTGLAAPVARFALERADQVILVSTPQSMTMQLSLSALDGLDPEKTTFVVNKAPPELASGRRGGGAVVLPYDERLKLMLESGAYSLAALPRHVRLPIKGLAAGVAERLV
jgi:Mrp family chromosome partitioning ATPase